MVFNSYEQCHENARAVFKSYVQWFAFFWTLNAGAISFLFGSDYFLGEGVKFQRSLLVFGFIILNFLAVACSFFTFREMKRLVCSIHSIHQDGSALGIPFLKYVFLSTSVTFIMNILAWSYLAWAFF